MKKIFGTMTASGMLLILGAAGSCDFSGTSLSQTLFLTFIGLSMFLCGLLIPRYIGRLRRARLVTQRKMGKSICKAKKYAPAKSTAEARKNFVLITEV
jgi:hypothetical protein